MAWRAADLILGQVDPDPPSAHAGMDSSYHSPAAQRCAFDPGSYRRHCTVGARPCERARPLQGRRAHGQVMSHRASTAWSALAVTLAIQAVTSMAALTVPVVAPALAESLHVSPTLIGAYTTILYMGSMLGSVLAGSLVVRYGPIRASQLGLLLCAIGLALPAMAPGVASTAIAAWLLGMGVGPITPASSHLLARTTPPQHASLVFSIKQSGAPLGGAMAGLFVPALLLTGGVNATLLAVAAGNLACVLIAQPMRAELDGDRRASHPLTFNGLVGPIRLVVLHHGLARLTSFAFVFSAVQMCLATYLVTYLHTGLGYSLVAAGATFAAAQVGGVVGRVAWGFFADRCLGARRMLTLLAAAMSICCVAAAALQAGAPIPVVMGLMIRLWSLSTPSRERSVGKRRETHQPKRSFRSARRWRSGIAARIKSCCPEADLLRHIHLKMEAKFGGFAMAKAFR